jgi:glycosyltransferase involved in cell wall biosynthesis
MASAGKVLIIVQNLPVPFDRRVWLEASALHAAGYSVSVISPTGKDGNWGKKHEIIDGIHVYRYPAPPEANGALGYLFEFTYCWLMTAFLALQVWIRRGFDVIHACNPPETYFLLAIPYKLLGKKFIFDHHDLSPEMYLAKGGEKKGLLYRGLLWLERATFRSADVVITTNQSHKEVAMQRGKVPEDRIFIVRSGPDFDRLQIQPVENDLKAGFTYTACYLGEMCPQDGVDYLLKAIYTFVYDFDRQNTLFYLIGGGSALNELKEMASQLKLDGFVKFTGRVSDHDLCRHLSNADICLDPDPYTEWANQSTMNKIMEYMAFGKPIVAFDLKENRFSAQEAAVYAKPNDVREFASLMIDLLADQTMREQMGSLALRRVKEELAWEYSRPNLYAAYQKALGGLASEGRPAPEA